MNIFSLTNRPLGSEYFLIKPYFGNDLAKFRITK